MSKKQAIYVISDSVGETAQKVVAAVSAQFPELNPMDIRRYPFIEDTEMLGDILQEALKEKGIVVHTLVSRDLVNFVESFCRRTSLSYVDVMSPLTTILQGITGIAPQEQPGTLHQLDQDYFDRVAAIEFAVKYDDGKDPRGMLRADYVILGVSRTSKTPLSMYLANKNLKVANLPLIPEVPLPKELMEVDKEKMIGLTTSLESLRSIRKSRLKALGLKEDSSYSSDERILEEMAYAEALYQRLGIRIIHVEKRAIEETAALILEN
ncbi:pyruvate, water dikinase regulatory protein [Isobaculum melis]|uniref:Putative pyruvate, phosphate dikinase regulatory protein n=1 Tax=Isobaculum melis TaxID=142588 RepID=A0A1H9RSK1_9LACT|nr:pyruvate, water dikinase regulatory protein [Isobaculum melis]SER75528.1 hypothetical protein SAMN04488559_10535 [Isobaculum melis]